MTIHERNLETNVGKANDQLNRIVGDYPAEAVQAHMSVATVYMLGALVNAVQDLTDELRKGREAP